MDQHEAGQEVISRRPSQRPKKLDEVLIPYHHLYPQCFLNQFTVALCLELVPLDAAHLFKAVHGGGCGNEVVGEHLTFVADQVVFDFLIKLSSLLHPLRQFIALL